MTYSTARYLSNKTILWLAESLYTGDDLDDPFVSTGLIQRLYKLDFGKLPDNQVLHKAIAKAFPEAVQAQVSIKGKRKRGYKGLYLTETAETRLRLHLEKR